MPKTIIKCESCGEVILEPFDESKAQRCPRCKRMMSLRIGDLTEDPKVLRRLKSEAENRPRRRK